MRPECRAKLFKIMEVRKTDSTKQHKRRAALQLKTIGKHTKEQNMQLMRFFYNIRDKAKLLFLRQKPGTAVANAKASTAANTVSATKPRVYTQSPANKRKRRQINLTAIILSGIAAISILVLPTAQAFEITEVPDVMIAFINTSASEAYNQVLFNGSGPFSAKSMRMNATDAAIQTLQTNKQNAKDALDKYGLTANNAGLTGNAKGWASEYNKATEYLEKIKSGTLTAEEQADIKQHYITEQQQKELDVTNSLEFMSFNPFSGSDQSLFDMVAFDTSPENPVYAVMIGIKAVCLVVALISFASKYAIEMYNFKADPYRTMLEFLMKFTLCNILIVTSDKMAAAVIGIAYGLVLYIMQALTSVAVNAPVITVEDIVGDRSGGWLDWLEAVGIMVLLAGPFIMAIGIRLYAWFTAFSIMLDIGVRRALLPIGIIEFFHDGFRSPAVRYVKKLMAAVLRLAIASLVCAIGTYMAGSLAKSGGGATFTQICTRGILFCLATLVISFTEVVVISHSSEYANDALGV